MFGRQSLSSAATILFGKTELSISQPLASVVHPPLVRWSLRRHYINFTCGCADFTVSHDIILGQTVDLYSSPSPLGRRLRRRFTCLLIDHYWNPRAASGSPTRSANQKYTASTTRFTWSVVNICLSWWKCLILYHKVTLRSWRSQLSITRPLIDGSQRMSIQWDDASVAKPSKS